MHWELLLALLLLLLLLSLPASADAPPTDRFVETFESYDFADGARTTAWWDRRNGQLTLRQPDAGNVRRWPAVAATEGGGMITVWVEDRGAGPTIWAQMLDRYGNRLWDEDQALIAWEGAWSELPLESHLLDLFPASVDDYWLLRGDETGVWASRWSVEHGQLGAKIAITDAVVDDVALRCLMNVCGVIWSVLDAYHLALFTDEGAVTPLKTNDGPMQIAWKENGDLWVAWRGDGATQLDLYDAETWLPVWDSPLIIDENSEGPLDLVAIAEDIWLISGNPLLVSWLRQTDAGLVHKNSWTLADAATQARITAMSNKVSIVWQTAEPPAFWARWISTTGESLGADARLLRLGLPDQPLALGDIVATSDASTAVTWTEGDQVFARRWEGDGRSIWRHEVAPAYALTPGWVVSEGLAHSLAVNQPWQGIESVTLRCRYQLQWRNRAILCQQPGAEGMVADRTWTNGVVQRTGKRVTLVRPPAQVALGNRPGSQGGVIGLHLFMAAKLNPHPATLEAD